MSHLLAELDNNPLHFLCRSQCINYRQNTLLSLIYITNIVSITFLRLDNQQNDKSSPDLWCSPVPAVQIHSPWVTEGRPGKGWAVPLPHVPHARQ